MGTFLKKYFVLISTLLLALFMLSAWKFPTVAQAVLIAFVGFSLWAAISSIVVKHQTAYREGRLTRFAFARNIFLDVFGILVAMTLAALLGRYIAELVTKQIDGALLRFVAGMLIGLLVGIGAGILVRQTWGRFVKI